MPEHREQIGRQRREYVQAMTADRKVTGWGSRFEHATDAPANHTDVQGDQATVVDSPRRAISGID